MSHVPPAPPLPAAGPTCARSTLPPGLRIAITFALLFALKYGLPALGVPVAAQVLAILAVATACVWRFWWQCGPYRRGAIILLGSLWGAGLLKLVLR